MNRESPWYAGVTRYQWLVLTIASLGWIFDVFEGQIFVASMREAMPALLPETATAGTVSFYNNLALGSFLLGGALGGVFFGVLSDRIGRARTMVITILFYSLFTCVTAFAQGPWHMIILRFLVAMGVGGEWAVASAMVAEVFPAFARVRSLGIFHASSAFGSYLAIAAGAFIVGNESLGETAWRWGFAIGALPALLTIWIRLKLRETDRWRQAKKAAEADATKRAGRIVDLFSRELRLKTLVGVSLAAVGLATFWGVKIYGKDLMRGAAEREIVAALPATASQETKVEALKANFSTIKRAEMTGLFIVITGGLLGMLAFGPLSERIGRRGAFLFFHLGGFVSGAVLFGLFPGQNTLFYWAALPVFGILTSGMHAGYAVYFPELFPSRLRGTGGGFCFNMGRLIAAPILFVSGWMQKDLGFTLTQSAAILSSLFLLGAMVLVIAPETRGQDLPE